MDFLDFSNDSDKVKHLKSFYEAVARGNFNEARQHVDPSLEWVGPEAQNLWFGGTHRGVDAIFREVFEPSYGKIADFRLKWKRFYEIGDTVIAVGRITGRAKMTSRELDSPVAHIWTLHNGKAVRCQAYEDASKWTHALAEPATPQRMAA